MRQLRVKCSVEQVGEYRLGPGQEPGLLLWTVDLQASNTILLFIVYNQLNCTVIREHALYDINSLKCVETSWTFFSQFPHFCDIIEIYDVF